MSTLLDRWRTFTSDDVHDDAKKSMSRWLTFIENYWTGEYEYEERRQGIQWITHPALPLLFPIPGPRLSPEDAARHGHRAVAGMLGLEKTFIRMQHARGVEWSLANYEAANIVAFALTDILGLGPGTLPGSAETALLFFFARNALAEETALLQVFMMLFHYAACHPWMFFYADWRGAGQSKVRLDAKLAASLMFTDYPEDLIENVNAPWPLFILEVPDALLGEFPRLLVTHGESAEDPSLKAWSIYLETTEGAVEVGGANLVRLSRLNLSATDGSEHFSLSDRSTRAVALALRLLMGALALMNEPARHLSRPKLFGKKGRPKWLKEPSQSTDQYILGKDIHIDIDCRPFVQEYLDAKAGSIRSVRWPVRGHKRWQACGPKLAERKWIWVQPHWKGDQSAPSLVRTHVLDRSSDADLPKKTRKRG